MKLLQNKTLRYTLLGSAWIISNSISSLAAPVHTNAVASFPAYAVSATSEPTDTTTVQTPVTAQPLTTVQFKACSATSDSHVKLTWNKVQHAVKYEVYRAKSKKGEYTCIGSTKKPAYTDKKGKSLHTYYYKIKAISGDSITYSDSALSKTISVTVRKKAKKIAYVGDSIMTGFKGYGVLKGKGNRSFAKVGIHASNFYTSDYMKQLLQYNPDRMIIMLGMNSLVGSPSDSHLNGILSSYNKILNACHKKNSDIEIVVMGVSPTRGSSTVSNSAIRRFNKKLKRSIKKRTYIHYYEPAAVLSDQTGALQSKYSGGDGTHWSKAGYDAVYKDLQRYIKEW